MTPPSRIYTYAEYNQLIGPKEAKYRLSLKRQLSKADIAYESLERTEYLEEKLERRKEVN